MQPHKHKILISGNWDETLHECKGFESDSFDMTGIHYLCDSEVVIEGVKFYGSPKTHSDFVQAFTYYLEDADGQWHEIPDDTDVLITHGPMEGILDDGCGCKALRTKVEEVKPKLHLFGHIHQSHGFVESNGTTFSNASCVVNVFNLSEKD